MKTFPKINLQTALMVVTFLLLITNVFLIWENRSLMRIIEAPKSELIKEGDVLRDFDATTLDGGPKPIVFSRDSKKQVLLFFRTTCKFCHEQMKYWKALTTGINRADYDVIAFTTETKYSKIKDYVNKYQVNNWEVVSVQPTVALESKFGMTPLTAVVGLDGRVEKAWAGLWDEDQFQKVAAYFGISPLINTEDNS